MANEPSMCAGQAESLHQMRIGLRRLRAAIAIFADVVDDDELGDDRGRAQMDHQGAWTRHATSMSLAPTFSAR